MTRISVEPTARNELAEIWPFFVVVTLVLGAGYVSAVRGVESLRQPFSLALFTALCLLTGALYWLSPRLVSSGRWLLAFLLVQGAATFVIALLTPHHWLGLALYGALLGVAVASYWPRWRASVLAALACVALLAVNVVAGWGFESFVELLPAIGLMLVFVVVYVVLFVRQVLARQEAQALLRKLAAAHRQLQEYAAEVQQLTLSQERERMGLELHDTLAQGLAGLILQLEAVDGHLEGANQARAREVLQQAMQRARTTLREARRAIQALRPSVLEEEDLIEALAREVEQFTASTGIACRHAVAAEPGDVPPELAQPVLRIVQESLSNVARHAQATRAGVRLDCDDRGIRVVVEDDGVGFDLADQAQGFGLAGMRERARLVGGELTVESSVGNGAKVVFVAPGGES